MSDEDLLHEISLTSSIELELINKLKLKTSVNEVLNVAPSKKDSETNTEKKKSENILLSEINKLSVKVSELSSVCDEIRDVKKQLADADAHGGKRRKSEPTYALSDI